MRIVVRRLACFFAALLFATAAAAQDRPRVVTVNYPLQYFAERLLGDAAEVEFPVPEGVDPSFWRPAIADISAIQSADLILLNGAGFATWIDRVSLPRSRIVNTSAAFSDRYIATESITHSHGDGGEHSHEGIASYTWLDLSLAVRHAEAIAAAVSARGLAEPGEVYARFDALRAELQTLDSEARAALAGAKDTVFIASHPRYQYLARAYDLEIVSLEWDAGAAPGAQDLAELRTLVEETGAGVLIWEAEPPAEALEATANLGLQNLTFPPLAQRAPGGDFIETFRAALAALSAAEAPGN